MRVLWDNLRWDYAAFLLTVCALLVVRGIVAIYHDLFDAVAQAPAALPTSLKEALEIVRRPLPLPGTDTWVRYKTTLETCDPPTDYIAPPTIGDPPKAS